MRGIESGCEGERFAPKAADVRAPKAPAGDFVTEPVGSQDATEAPVTGGNGAAGNGAPSAIAVANPATGETIATVPELGADEVAAMVAAARAGAADLGGGRVRGPGRGAARRAPLDGRQRASGSWTTIVGETGRPADETQLAELAYGLSALEFWAEDGARLPRRRGDRVARRRSFAVAGSWSATRRSASSG